MARIAAALLDPEHELLVIDEADALLQSATGVFGLFGMRTGSYDKAELNSFLDELSVPTVWITNEIRGIPSSALRRFAHVCEFPRPTNSTRRRMWEDRLSEAGLTPSASFIDQVSAGYDLTPSAIDRVVAVIDAERTSEGSEDSGGVAATNALEDRTRNYLAAASQGPLSSDFRALPRPPRHFDPMFCASSVPIPDLCAQADRMVAAGRSVKLLFDGPPGGGKTHCALYLAQRLDREARVVRPSDLISPYVGETEKNIAREFRSAYNERTVLILDEADAVLGDRGAAHRSYELRWASLVSPAATGFRRSPDRVH
jgi:SpoVK/Ycf46/Vps4 family AAA+-type ATPase